MGLIGKVVKAGVKKLVRTATAKKKINKAQGKVRAKVAKKLAAPTKALREKKRAIRVKTRGAKKSAKKFAEVMHKHGKGDGKNKTILPTQAIDIGKDRVAARGIKKTMKDIKAAGAKKNRKLGRKKAQITKARVSAVKKVATGAAVGAAVGHGVAARRRRTKKK